jgi:hypothetical protein
MVRCCRNAWIVAGFCLLAVAAIVRAAVPVDFDRDIRPILSDACFHCHGPDGDQRKAGLRLDTREGLFADLGGYHTVIPHEPQASELYRRIATTDPDDRMPPPDSGRTLSPEQVQTLRRWIEQGAAWSGHWSLEPPRRPALPTADSSWERSAIDRFIAARLKREGMSPAPPADRPTLIRRLSLDLTGLPPTIEEVEAFVNDGRPDAYERLVDRLLQSPRFGEHWAWAWLEAARYADSNGYQGDGERTMWPWRDWVTAAFNRNLPYDEFTVWQIAGDLLPDATIEQKIATGFCRNHPINGEGGRIPEENRVEYIFDQLETVGTVWLGLTFNCTRCHDHKYDPLTRRDYYGLFAFFNQTPVQGVGGNPQTPPVIELPTDVQRVELAELEQRITAAAAAVEETEKKVFPREQGTAADSPAANDLPEGVKAALRAAPRQRNVFQLREIIQRFGKTQPDYARPVHELRELVARRDAVNGDIVRVMVMQDRPDPRPTFILNKGLYNQPADEVGAATPQALPPMAPDAPRNRLGLARWLVAPDHPLTPRVTVNHFWQHLFGAGLVKTPEDFGSQGERPEHPELLDWLATEFVRTGWDVKRLCRLIVTSATYRQTSRATPADIERDPDNRLLARGARYRLASPVLRDQALTVGGLLVGDIGGAPVNPYQPPGIWEEATFGTKRYVQDSGPALYRRSIYTFWRRIAAPTLFFDTASRQTCTVTQTRTNSPGHALTTLNDVTYVEAARAMAQRVLAAAEPSDAHRIDLAFRTVLARSATKEEADVLAAGVHRLRAQYASDPSGAQALLNVGELAPDGNLDTLDHAVFTALCLAILNLDESLSRE